MTRENWRERFEEFARTLVGTSAYVTVDLDCLNEKEAVTDWEQGLFTAEDVAWALGQIRRHTQILGGDLCGASSEPRYARWFQRFAGNWDHPKLEPVDRARAEDVNRSALETIWSLPLN